MSAKRIKVKGIRRNEIDAEQLAFVFWTLAKRQVGEKRERQARDKARLRKSRRGK